MMITLDRRYMAAVGRPDLIKAAAGLAGPYDFRPFDVAASRNAFGRVPDPDQTQPVTFARRRVADLAGSRDRRHGRPCGRHDHPRLPHARGRRPVGAKLYPDLNHADLIATFSPLFRKKAPVLHDVSAFFHRGLG